MKIIFILYSRTYDTYNLAYFRSLKTRKVSEQHPQLLPLQRMVKGLLVLQLNGRLLRIPRTPSMQRNV